MECKKVDTRKYKNRPSPPYHASECKGKSMKGNDGAMYISKADAKGVYKWVHKESKTRKVSGKRYEIHDNYSRPFFVNVDSKQKSLVVLKTKYDEKNEKYLEDKQIFQTKFKDIFLGDNKLRDPNAAPFGWGKGNSILVHVNSDYIYIGSEIYSFQAVKGDMIVDYHSPVGNNDVPYPVAIGKTYAYFMLSDDYMYVPLTHFDMKKDLYAQFYGYTVDEETKKAIEKDKKKFKIKMIHKRVL